MDHKFRLSIILVMTVVVCAATAYAHHSVTALYDFNKNVKVQGKLVSFSFRSPHSFIIVEAPDEKGVMQRWDVAWNSARELAANGINREAFKPGDVVQISGNPGRKPGEHIIRMVHFLRPSDGLTWGTRPGETFQ